MFSASNKIIVVIVVALLTLGSFMVFEAIQLSHTSPWMNMTDKQVTQETERLLSLKITACEKQGGDWVVPATSSSYCTVAYQHPDVSSWWVEPIPNTQYSQEEYSSYFSIIAAGGFFLIALYILIEFRRELKILPSIRRTFHRTIS